MPQFFVPSAGSSEEAERLYTWLQQNDASLQQNDTAVKRNPIKTSRRVFRIWFRHDGLARIAEVAKEIAGWSQSSGKVFAIFELPQSISIYTQFENGLIGPPICVPQEHVTSRTYFDDQASNAWEALVTACESLVKQRSA